MNSETFINLHEEKNFSWDELLKMAPDLPRGWFELSRFSKDERVEFTIQFWQTKLPINEAIVHQFLNQVDDVSIFLTKETLKSYYKPHMLYSLKNDAAFFQGGVPIKEENIFHLRNQFESVPFPSDYLAFLEIHDGFSRYHDRGIIPTKEIAKTYLKFQDLLLNLILLSKENVPIIPSSLIPFYESENLHDYQCFFCDASSDKELINLSFHYEPKQKVSYLNEEECYSSFLQWLEEYLNENRGPF